VRPKCHTKPAVRDGDAHAFAAAIRRLRGRNWIVCAKPPFGSPEHVLAYLGRYTHRVAIANSRLVSADETSVVFRWRDYRHGNAPRLMSLDPHEFIHRFLIHSLPDGFHRSRHYGFLANGCRRARLAIIRQRLVTTEPTPTAADQATRPLPRFDPTVCPCCGGILRITAAHAMAHRAVTTAARYLMTTRYRPNIDRRSVTASAPTDAGTPHARHLFDQPKSTSITPQPAQKCQRTRRSPQSTSALRPRLHRQAALHHPRPLTWNRPRDTNPIARGRVSAFAQSGFNEVAHRAKPDLHRRATSQNPPDS
jgi:hypothetical protein